MACYKLININISAVSQLSTPPGGTLILILEEIWLKHPLLLCSNFLVQ